MQGGEGGREREEGRGRREIGRVSGVGAWGCRELELLLINNVVTCLQNAILERDLLIQWIQRSCFWGLLFPQFLIISHLL